MMTKVLDNEFKGKKLFTIFVVDEDGNEDTDHYPVVSMGIKKAKAIIKHLDEFKKYVEDNS